MAFFLFLHGPTKAQSIPVDLELILAVDASASIDTSEYRLQMQGIADAFRDPDVQDAIGSGPLGKILVGLVTWAEAEIPKDFSGWFVLSTPEDANQLAGEIEKYPRRVSGGTGIGSGLAYAVRLIEQNAYDGSRKTIDVSGDGPETPPRRHVVMMPQARTMANIRGVTINGLAILNEVPDLDTWYRNNVTTGPGNFVLKAVTMDDFANAMRRKLYREILTEEKLSQVNDVNLNKIVDF